MPLATRVQQALVAYRNGGFGPTLLRDPDREEIRQAVQALLDDRSVEARLVHVISHGQ